MNKFSYGNYNSNNTDIAFDSTKGYVEPSGEQETRKELSYPLKELKDYINNTASVNGADQTIRLRVNDQNLIQYSLDGTTWLDTASGGHQILNDAGQTLPQTTKLMFRNTRVFSDPNNITVVEGLQGEQGVGVASVVQVGSSSVSEGQNIWRMTLTNGSTYDFIVLNGEQGEQGEMGTGLIILGSYASLEDLQRAHPTGNKGDCYIVGTNDSNPAYVWDVNDQAWESIGKIRGEKGETGATGAQGVSVQSVVETQHSTADGGENIWTVTLSNGATSTFSVYNGTKGSAGTGMPSGGTTGQSLVKRTDLDYDLEWKEMQDVLTAGTGIDITDTLISAVNQFDPILRTGIDLNTIIDSGVYVVNGGSTALNFPSGPNGILIVSHDSTYNIIRQFYFRIGTINSNDYYWYSRQIAPSISTYGDWVQMYNSKSLTAGDGINISSGGVISNRFTNLTGVDLNTVKYNCLAWCNDACTNLPSGYGGMLLCCFSSNNSSYGVQILSSYATSGKGVFYRRYNGGTWSDWVELVSEFGSTTLPTANHTNCSGTIYLRASGQMVMIDFGTVVKCTTGGSGWIKLFQLPNGFTPIARQKFLVADDSTTSGGVTSTVEARVDTDGSFNIYNAVTGHNYWGGTMIYLRS